MPIPIKNLYYIFCYAWASFPSGDLVDVGKDEAPELQNLFAKLLIDHLHRVIRRGLARGYISHTEDLRGPRGRLLFDQIVKRQTLLRGEAACQFDELKTDILKNQIVKATARMLERSPNVAQKYRHELGALVRRLEAVSDIRLSSGAFRRVQIFRNDHSYSLLMKLCEFVFQSALPDENGENGRFADVLGDEVIMSAVFEDFLRNFFVHEQKTFKVSRDQYLWDAVGLTASAHSLLPVMQTDLVLRSQDRTIVADAKYYKETLKGRDKSAPKLNSSNLYQLFTYLHHAQLREPDKRIDGMLIYPSVGYEVRADYEFAGKYLRIATVDLNRPWPQIHEDLLALIQDDLPISASVGQVYAS